jgi:hypothetical protein
VHAGDKRPGAAAGARSAAADRPGEQPAVVPRVLRGRLLALAGDDQGDGAQPRQPALRGRDVGAVQRAAGGESRRRRPQRGRARARRAAGRVAGDAGGGALPQPHLAHLPAESARRHRQQPQGALHQHRQARGAGDECVIPRKKKPDRKERKD